MEKHCFIICPIGEEGSDVREWSDDIYENLLRPLALEYDYHARRAIDGSRPGEITSNIVDDIVKADLVIADLTFLNANVFYELALRHSLGSPFLHVAAAGTKIPFDVSAINTVFIDRRSFKAIDRARSELKIHMQAIQEGKASFENPVKRHQQKLKADQSGDSLESRVFRIEERIENLARTAGGSRGGLMPLLEVLDRNRFAALNNQILHELDDDIVNFLTTHIFEITFNPSTGASKPITFEKNGIIGEGRNNNEFSWKVSNGRLEILDSTGSVYSRFIYVKPEKSLYHTNDPDTKSIKGQVIRASD